MKHSLFVMLLFILHSSVQAQEVTGKITDASNGQSLPGASVHWSGSASGTVTDVDGRFRLLSPPQFPAQLVLSYTGYMNDTLRVLQAGELSIRMKPNLRLKEVEITETREAVSFSTIDPLNKQSLTTKEFKKAACCNLSESFETNATVDVTYSDAVSGSKQIKILGLDGSYTQVMMEQMPGIRGLSSVSGYAHIPGTWVNNIDITKGVGTVVHGYESISGQINIDLLKPEKADRLHVNLYAGDAGRFESNVHLGHRFNKKWSTLLLTHASGVVVKNDFNKDGFMDVPLSSQFNVLNKWKYEDPGKLMMLFGMQALKDTRTGGQMTFNSKADNDNGTTYGVNIDTRHLEGFGKAAIGINNRPYKSLGVTTHLRAYEQNAFYGFKTYRGGEQTLTANLMYQTIIGTTLHKVKIGGSYMLDNYQEAYRDSAFKRMESVPGIFAEYNYDLVNKVSVLAGLRGDYHNLYGPMINPRLHIKWQLLPLTVLRLSGGRGMRVANVFIETPATMASSRQVVVQEKLRPEVAWNYGTSFIQKFHWGKQNGSLVLDYYRTDFENQVVADLDANPQQVIFYNLKGQSYSNSFQAEANYEPIKKFELRLAYKWQDVKTTYHGTLLQKPLIARDRVLFNMAYTTRFDKWKYDFTAKWFGKNRIPSTGQNPDGLRLANYSSPYYVFNAQVTRAFKKWEVYVGVENIFDYTQRDQVIDRDHPFGPYFDASMIWGPVMGRVTYIGLRFTIK